MGEAISASLKACLLSGVSAVILCGTAAAQEPPRPAEDAPLSRDNPRPTQTAVTPEPAGEQPEEGETGEVEEVVVVGSQIVGAPVTGVLPVTVLSEQDIEAVAPANGDELFRSIPQAGDVAFNESRDAGGINDARGDTASINLRALGTGNTLVLLNGRRMVLHPGTQAENLVPVTTVNTNAIPVKGVRRLEVLRDGAAAIYGTDAVAGVINTVLKSNFEGFGLEFEAGFSEGTDMQEYDGSFEWGRDFNGGRSNLSVFGQFTSRDPLFAREREYARSSDLRPRVAGTAFEGDRDFDNRSTITPWAEFIRLDPITFRPTTVATRVNSQTLTTSGVFHVQPAGNEGCVAPAGPGICYDNGSLATLSTDENLRYNINEERTLLGETDRLNLFAFFNHDLSETIEFYGELGGYFSDFNSVREQESPLSAARIIIPANAFYNPLGPVGSPNRLPGLTTGTGTAAFPAGGAPLQLQDYRLVDIGPQNINVKNTTTRVLGGFRGEYRGFDWDTALLYSRARSEDTQDSISNTLFQQAVARTTPDAYNPFNGGDLAEPGRLDTTASNQAAIDSFVIDVFRNSETSLTLADFKVSRNDLFTLPGGPVGVAAGVEIRHETFEDDRDPRLDGTITFTNLAGEFNGSDVLGVSPTPDTEGSRDVRSAFVEFAVPVVSPEQGIPLVHSIDLQLAARHENYTAFGGVTKPKVAAAYRPVGWLQFRAAYSQGFRAPNLPQLFERGVQRSNTRTDLIKCEAQLRAGTITNFDDCIGASQGVVSNRSGSQSLTPEEAENITYGVVLESDFIPRRFGRITATADYWKIDQTDIVGIFGDANHIALDYLLRVRGSFNPAVQRADPTPEEIALFEGSGLEPVGRITQVIDNYVNLNPREVEGVDLGVYYDLDDTPLGDFSVNFNAARLLTFFQVPSPEAAEIIAAQASGEINTGFNVAGAQDLVRQNGRPEWRWTSTVTWRNGGWGAGLYSAYVGDVIDTGAVLPDGTPFEVDSWLTHNVYGQYTFDTSDLLNDTRIRLGVRNIADEDPPLADATFGYLGELHSPRGRWFYANISKRF